MAGYNGYSKSNNAIAAEEAGLVTLSKITKTWLTENGIEESVKFVKYLIKLGIIVADEWHHTSKFYNQTNYYSAETIREELELRKEHKGKTGISFYEALQQGYTENLTDLFDIIAIFNGTN
ncbi:hypothetical protein [Arcanobacterium buesumense]|uniref:Uncharacterized protein n=1 Tax=Arcanobacterium buesumense TaxID=2722751 RepID=A0A6H2ELQ0_9ACTO|nr:hypothetical protein [Arcanobacterium buesumense]QJC21992.1 hypothetical protein HC352_05410 [Arcanobacterium buesumense]